MTTFPGVNVNPGGGLGRLKGVTSGAGLVAPSSITGSRSFAYTEIHMQGFNTLHTHLAYSGAVVRILTRQAVETVGQLTAALAREIHRPHIRTGQTFRSIRLEGQEPADGFWGSGDGIIHWDGDSYSVDVIAEGGRDPEAPAARMLEFGFYHVGAGRFVGPFPFMFPAADKMTVPFVRVMRDIASVVDDGALTTFSGASPAGNVAEGLPGTLQTYRKYLYSTAKALGDIAIFIPSPWVGGLRSLMYKSARGIGDTRSAMMGTLGSRLGARVTGRFSGRGIAASRTSFLSGSFGPGYQRVYNRVIGREVGKLGLRRSF